jgi:ferredoxin
MLIKKNDLNIFKNLILNCNILFHSYSNTINNNNNNKIFFNLKQNNKLIPIYAKENENLLDICKKNNINLIAACEGNCACSTCHVILDNELYKKLPNPSDEEEDMLELAYNLTPTSRLACQLKINKHFEGRTITIPDKQRNLSYEMLNKNLNKKI